MRSMDELKKVMQIEGIDRKSGRLAREKALEGWINDWVVEVSTSQSIIKSNFTSDEFDFLKYYLATKIGDELMNDCISVDNNKTSIVTKILALKRNIVK